MKHFCSVCSESYERQVESMNIYIPNTCSKECFLEYVKGCTPDHTPYGKVSKQTVSRRSNYERAFEDFLKENDVKYYYEPHLITLQNGLNYCPDYFLTDHKVWIEVKGLWEGKAKRKFKQFHKEKGIILINHWFLTKILKKNPRNYRDD